MEVDQLNRGGKLSFKFIFYGALKIGIVSTKDSNSKVKEAYRYWLSSCRVPRERLIEFVICLNYHNYIEGSTKSAKMCSLAIPPL